MSTKFRLPAIMIGATASAISFGTSTFPIQIQAYISVIVGTTSLMIAIINTIESYLEISKTMTASLMTSTSMKKLSDDILCELALEVEGRETSGIFFLRTIYTRYQQIITSAPPLDVDKPGTNEVPARCRTDTTDTSTKTSTGTETSSSHVIIIPKDELKETAEENAEEKKQTITTFAVVGLEKDTFSLPS